MTGRHVVLIGNVNVDMIMGPQVPWPEAGTEVVLPDYELRVGGQAANTALAFNALGVPHRIIANLGNDVFARWLRDQFGMAAAGWHETPVPTTVSVGITHPNGERTFFTNLGHLDAFGPEHILPEIAQRAPDGSVALLVAAFLSPRVLDGLPAIISTCRDANYAVAFDPGWPPGGWTAAIRAGFSRWLAEVDILLFNEAETRGLAGTDALPDAVARIRQMMPATASVVVKRGPDGARAWRGDEEAHYPSPHVTVADSIGAGDIFNAGFIWALLQGRDLRGCLAAGVELASAAIATRPRSFDPAVARLSAARL